MPTPIRWSVPIDLSPADAAVAAKVQRRGKFYVFLRAIRHELFDEAFQAELAAVYQPRGTRPLPPAQLAMALLLQRLCPGGRCRSGRECGGGPPEAIGVGVLGR